MEEPERTETHTESERAEEQKIRDRKKQKNAALSLERSVLDPIELSSFGWWTVDCYLYLLGSCFLSLSLSFWKAQYFSVYFMLVREKFTNSPFTIFILYLNILILSFMFLIDLSRQEDAHACAYSSLREKVFGRVITSSSSLMRNKSPLNSYLLYKLSYATALFITFFFKWETHFVHFEILDSNLEF